MDNYDGGTKNLLYFIKIPNLLVNGSNGIAVGIWQLIYHHITLQVVINAAVKMIDNKLKKTEIQKLMK